MAHRKVRDLGPSIRSSTCGLNILCMLQLRCVDMPASCWTIDESVRRRTEKQCAICYSLRGDGFWSLSVKFHHDLARFFADLAVNDQILPTFTMDRRYVGRPVICLRRVYSLLRIVTALISNVPVLALHLADTDADTFLASHPLAAGQNQMIICPLIYTQCVQHRTLLFLSATHQSPVPFQFFQALFTLCSVCLPSKLFLGLFDT